VKSDKNKQLGDKLEQVKVDKSEVIERVGRAFKARLDSHFAQWTGGLPFKVIMSNYSYKAKALGMDVGELAQELEAKGFIKIINSPSGARYLFSGDCPLTETELMDWLSTQEQAKELSRAEKAKG